MRIDFEQIVNHLKENNYIISTCGTSQRLIDKYCSVQQIGNDCILWIKKMGEFNQSLLNGKNNLIIVTDELPPKPLLEQQSFIICANSKGAYFEVLSKFFNGKRKVGISKFACVETQNIGKEVSIGAFSYVCPEVVIGNHVTICNNVSIECPTYIGDNTIIGSGTVIGTSGFGYFETPSGEQKRVPHFGLVRIGEHVEIGANVCIDRGTLAETKIGNHVKIDNLCHIAHNVQIDDGCLVIAMSTLGGSVHLCENSYIAPGVLVINQATIGKDAMVGLGAVVTKDVEPNKVVVGVPAKIIRDRYPGGQA